MTRFKVEMDIREFMAGAKRHLGWNWPLTVVNAFFEIAGHAHGAAKDRTSDEFDLQSNFITDAIKFVPNTNSQKNAAINSLIKHNDLMAAVYVRGASKPKNSLDFMADHEYSGTRTPHGKHKALAMPQEQLKTKAYRTGRGKTAKRWKPQELLKRYRETGSTYNDSTTTNKGQKLGPQRRRIPGSPFIIRGKAGTPMIARRLSFKKKGDLEFLYALKDKGFVPRRWEFTEEVWKDVGNTYGVVIPDHIRRMKF